MGKFDELIQSGFWAIPKLTFAILCKTVHIFIIIPVSSDPLNQKSVERKGKKLQKLEYLTERKELFRWN